MSDTNFTVIVAADRNDVIGLGNDLPWYLPSDLRHFKQVTLGRVVLMGHSTHQSIQHRLGRPLPGRFSVVLSRTPHASGPGITFATELDEATALASAIAVFAARPGVCVIGGRQVFDLTLPKADRIYLTRVEADVAGDTFMPTGWLDGFKLVDSEDPHQAEGDQYPCRFQIYERSES